MDATPAPRTPTHRDGPMLFVDDLDAPEISSDDYHHVAKVLRHPDGTPIVLCDGAGSWRRATLARRPEPTGEVVQVPAPAPRVGVAFTLIKGDRPELVVQKLTELGVDAIWPITTDNAVVKPKGERAAKLLDRFGRIAREASMQCRRTHLPTIGPLHTWDSLVAERPGVIRCDAGAPGVGSVVRFGDDGPDEVLVAVGPEGGWSDRERAVDVPTVGIGDHILRAETAAIAVGALLTARRSGLI